jgi:hypothetical protein
MLRAVQPSDILHFSAMRAERTIRPNPRFKPCARSIIVVKDRYSWKISYPEFRESITRGKIEADAHVAEALYRRACGYSHPAVKIFMPAGASAPVYAHYTEHYPPDANAALRWLMNRQPERWRDRRNMEHTGSVDVRLMQMTPDERAADAVALVQRIQARLAAARAIEYEAEE